MERKTQTGYLILADISGYTSFVAQTEIEHADMALSFLLETIIEELSRLLNISKLDLKFMIHHLVSLFNRSRGLEIEWEAASTCSTGWRTTAWWSPPAGKATPSLPIRSSNGWRSAKTSFSSGVKRMSILGTLISIA